MLTESPHGGPHAPDDGKVHVFCIHTKKNDYGEKSLSRRVLAIEELDKLIIIVNNFIFSQ